MCNSRGWAFFEWEVSPVTALVATPSLVFTYIDDNKPVMSSVEGCDVPYTRREDLHPILAQTQRVRERNGLQQGVSLAV